MSFRKRDDNFVHILGKKCHPSILVPSVTSDIAIFDIIDKE